MSHFEPTGASHALIPNVWTLLEEAWNDGSDHDRSLIVPPGLVVQFRHNFGWPFWHHEIDLGEGTHNFFRPAGWNKFQVRLIRGIDPDAVVTWIM